MPDASLLAAALQDVGTRLRAAVTAAGAGTPLYGVAVPENRHKVPDIDPVHPIVLVRMPRFRRSTLKDTIPAFDCTISFTLDVLVASGRDASNTLDQRLIDLLDAIDGVLFEDPEWVAQWEEIVSADVDLPDVGHEQFDVVLAIVTIDVAVGREYRPKKGTVAFEGIGCVEGPDAGTAAGVVVATVTGHPDETHRITFDFNVEQGDP